MSSPEDEGSDVRRDPPSGNGSQPVSRREQDPTVAFNRGFELLLYSVAPVATLATAPILAHGLGPEGRGQYGVAIAVATLVATLGGWGQAEIFLSRSRSSTDYYRMHSRISWIGGLSAGVLCAGAILVLGLPWSTALLTAVSVPLLTQMGLWRAVSIAQGRLKAPALDSALGPLLRVVILAMLVTLAALSADSAIFASQAAIALGTLLTVGVASWRIGLRTQRREVGAVSLLRSGTAIIGFNLLHAVTLRADVIVLQLVATPVEVGLYAAPASLTTAALALSTAYKPRVQAAAFAARPFPGIIRNCLQVLVLAMFGTVALWIATPLAVELLFGSRFEAAEPIMRTLAFAIAPLLMVDLIFGALIVLGRRRQLLVVAAGSAAANLLALGALCPLYGAQGAAVATVISYSFATVLGFVVLARATREVQAERQEPC